MIRENFHSERKPPILRGSSDLVVGKGFTTYSIATDTFRRNCSLTVSDNGSLESAVSRSASIQKEYSIEH